MYDEALSVLASWSGYPALNDVMKALPELDVYLTGGVLRDIVLRRPPDPKDFDFLVGGASVDAAVARLQEHGTVTRGPFGSPRWLPGGAGSAYADVIPIDRFHNGLWPCEDVVDALLQFDFTGNALALDLRRRMLHDPVHGRRDMARRVMRAVRFDYPDEPIAPGHSLTRLSVLWFRLLHYSRALALDIEPVTHAWLQAHRAYVTAWPVFAATFFSPAFEVSLEHL